MILKDASVSRTEWISFLADNPFTTPFQTPGFFDFYNSIPGSSASVFAVEEAGEIHALCVVTFQKEKGIKGYFSRRAIIYGGPVMAAGKKGDSALSLLLKAIGKELKNKVIYIETRNFNSYSNQKESFAAEGWSYEPYLDVQIDLCGKTIEEIAASFKYNRRREINLSIKEGSTSDVASNTEEVLALYNILHNLYKERVNLPLPSADFFLNLFLSTVGKVFIVKHNNKVIGGSFCLYYDANAIFTMYYCGLRDYHPKIFPTHLAIMAAIDFGLKNNLKMVDLMGAGKPGQEYGVRKYKAEFGGELVENGRFLKTCNPLLFSLGKKMLALKRKLKK